MKHSTNTSFSHLLRWLLAWMVLIGLVAGSAIAESSGLTPEDLSYENGNIVLSKDAERVGPDEWKVTVKATIGEVPVEKRKMEVVFVLDSSGSMAWCTDEAAHNAGSHEHGWNCREVDNCGKDEHTHTLDECYEYECEYEQEHTHTTECYRFTCGTSVHSHSLANGCYSECTRAKNSDHYNRWLLGYYHITSGTTCTNIDGKYYEFTCQVQEHEHGASCSRVLECSIPEHHHDDDCNPHLTCPQEEHTHTDDCTVYSCGLKECYHTTGGNSRCYYYDRDGNRVYYSTRMETAISAVKKISGGLGSEVDITYVDFDSSARVVTSLDDVEAQGGTYLSSGVRTGINQFTGGSAKTEGITKVLVVVADGDSDDGYNPSNLNTFKNNGGIVYAVGFNNNDSNLAGFTGNGGTYMHATNAEELQISMDKIENALTAMLEDPMGTAVGFEKTSIESIQTSGGSITSTDDTIYWHPSNDGLDTVSNSTIEYSYTVRLNDQADMSTGEHTGIPLNNPTNFLYGIQNRDGTTKMNSAAFPIPHATYAVSSLQTRWQYNGTDIQTPTAWESVISDYADAEYIPAFQQDYQTITPVIPVPNSNDYYQYVGTTVTRTMTVDGREEEDTFAGTDAVDATEAAEYVVIHQYELIKANELAVGGSKTLIGRDFLPGDSFTFTLTAETDGAPMPEGATSPQTITIEPDSGTSAAFTFGTISYNTAGTYEYTIQEQAGSQDGVVYDTREHRLVVTVSRVNNQMVATYTLDGVENGHLLVSNRLQTGTLKIGKRTVTSHLPEHQEKEFSFLVSIKDASGRPLNGSYEGILSDGSTQTLAFANGMAAVTLRQGESIVISGLPDGAAYTVTERAMGGFTATATGDIGAIEANQQREAVFDNTYRSEGRYQFIGTKQVKDATLAQDQFTFSVLDETGNVVARGKNNADGSFFLDTLFFTQEDIGPDGTGEKTYTIVEDPGTEPGYIYDRTRYEVTLTLMDNGEGVIYVADNLNGVPLVFENLYITGQFAISKKVEGNLGSKNRDFSFSLAMPDMAGMTISVSTDGGASFAEMTLNAQGTHTFTLRDGQSIIFYPVSGAYTVTETDPGSYTTTYSIDQGAAVEGTSASGRLDESGGHVAFVNTLQVSTPTGVSTSSASALMGLCLAACLIAIARAGRRCSRLDE